MLTLLWLLILLGVGIALAYRRTHLLPATLVLGVGVLAYTLVADGWFWKLVLWALVAVLVFLNAETLRRDNLTRRIIGVYPAAALPEIALRNGARLVIVNAQETPFDTYADAVSHATLGEFLPALAARVGVG